MEMTVNLAVAALVVAALGTAASDPPARQWPIHDESRPQPPVVDPGPPPERPAPPPSDAVVLFDGKDLSQWRSAKDGGAAKWKVENGYVEVVPGTGDIRTRPSLRRLPAPRRVGHARRPVDRRGPGPRATAGCSSWAATRSRSSTRYENRTYPDGQAAALYGQYPPLVNACAPAGRSGRPTTSSSAARGSMPPASSSARRVHRPPQRRPRPGRPGAARTHGPRGTRPPYQTHADKLPLGLQDHDHPVRYRNIWIRELGEPEPQLPRE